MAYINSISIGGEQFEIQGFPTVRSLPAVAIAPIGTNVEFSVSDSIAGTGATFQWYYSVTGKSWANSNFTGNKTATLKVTSAESRNGYIYRCKISYGDNSVYSTPSKLIAF